uniref:Solute carrier family 23 member 3 n=1 Tax=Eptatretus burgeri TaxID=7764 RepID=A0A8C4QDE5_EPTBU
SWVVSRLPLLHGGSLVAHVPLASITRRSSPLCYFSQLGAALLIAGIVQVVFGIAAIAGRVSAVCGPLVLAPSISLLGLAGYQQSATFSGEHWGLATGTITLMLICSQYLGGVYVPLPRCLSACSIRLPLLRLFSVLHRWPMVFMCTVLIFSQSTCLSAFTRVFCTLQGRRGAPVFSADAVSCGLTLAILASMETLGCEVLASRLLHCPVPPQHTLNRGLSVQGATTMMAGALSCPAVGVAQSTLGNGFVCSLVQEGSRLSVLLATALCILLSLSPRLTLFLTTLPTPAVGGLLCVTHSFAVAAGISYFQYLDIDSGRNIFIAGFSLFMALLLPCWLQRHTSGSCTGTGFFSDLTCPAFLHCIHDLLF